LAETGDIAPSKIVAEKNNPVRPLEITGLNPHLTCVAEFFESAKQTLFEKIRRIMADHDFKSDTQGVNDAGIQQDAAAKESQASEAQANLDAQDQLINEPDLAAQLVEAQARATEYHDAFLRAKAEQENIRRRAQEDISKAHKYSVESFAEALVPVIDSLEAALTTEAASAETMRSGTELTLKQLQSAFEKAKLTAINPLGEKFDPNKHQAISMVPAPEGVPGNHVVAVLQKGYLIADRILRPALVTVAQG
jgi:molecular chaperone GrpE